MSRFTIDIDDQFNDTLTKLANGGSKAEVIRKAVATYQYLKSEVPNVQSGNRVSISDANGNVQKVVILP
jgi:N-acetylglutamate synthase/N-acetylornithine aminotransferase